MDILFSLPVPDPNPPGHSVVMHGLDELAFFAGRVYRPEYMATHLNAGDVCVSSSLSDGLCTSLVEAIAFALAVGVFDA